MSQCQCTSQRTPTGPQAGAVAYREAVDGEIEILLVSALTHPGSWVFPLGTVEPGETLQRAALRECIEESGCVVDVGPEVETVDLRKTGAIQRIIFFAGRVIDEVNCYEAGRCRRWVRVSELVEAAQLALHATGPSRLGFGSDSGLR